MGCVVLEQNVVAFVLSIHHIFPYESCVFQEHGKRVDAFHADRTAGMEVARLVQSSRSWHERDDATERIILSAMACGYPRRHSNSWRRRAILNESEARWQKGQLSDGTCVAELQGTGHQ